MTSPTVAGPTRSTPGWLPPTKSELTRSTLSLTRRAIERSGMYSANGTGCRLTYISDGPRSGCHTSAVLR